MKTMGQEINDFSGISHSPEHKNVFDTINSGAFDAFRHHHWTHYTAPTTEAESLIEKPLAFILEPCALGQGSGIAAGGAIGLGLVAAESTAGRVFSSFRP